MLVRLDNTITVPATSATTTRYSVTR